MKIKQIIRFDTWWNFIIPPILAFVYLLLLLLDILLGDALFFTGQILVWMAGAASFGYFVNNLCDTKNDARAGKENETTLVPVPLKIVIIGVSLLCALVPWIYLSDSLLSFGLVLFHLVLLCIYSVPPLRLKNNVYLGIIIDTLYSIVVPLLIVFAAFNDKWTIDKFNLLIAGIICWSFLKGLRNILMHQLNDRKSDLKAQHTTLVLKIGPAGTVNGINYFILPVEIIVFSFICVYISFFIDYFYAGFCIFLLFTCLKFSLWKIFVLPPRHFRLKFLYFLNDFYEEWLPVIAIVFLVLHKIEYLVLLMLHILLFPRGIIHFFKDIVIIQENLSEK